MKQEDKNYILEQMKPLIGTSLLKIGRLAATGNFSFSSLDEKEYWLRIQTAFRIRTQDKIRIANLDMFEPTHLLKDNPSFNWDTFDWDVQGSNLYDELAEQLKEHYEKPITVQNIVLSDFGDLTIELNHSLVLELFVNAAEEECWRFFETKDEKHLVVTGQGIED